MSTSQLMAQVTALLSSWNEREREFRDWLAGTATGGPNGDGKYPLTNANGDTFLVDCPAKLADTVAGPAGVSLEAQEAAEEALAQAVNQALQATQQNTAAASARALTQQLRDEAEVFRDEAAASNAAAGAARSGAEAARDTATARANAAATSETNAGLSQITASQQATAAQAARVAAEVARDQAQAAAASINPATLATKAELQAELNALVGAAPGTLNTLNELAAALGNNPNFAATVTAQIATKADATHTHTIAQVTGLQTALDARAPLTHTHTIAQVTGLQAALDAKQNNIGFTPVQQGGGTDQGANKLFIGWHTSGDGLRLQVDSTNFGKVWPIDIQGTAGAVAWGNIVGRPSTFTPAAHGHAIADVSGLQGALDARVPWSEYNGSGRQSLTANGYQRLPGGLILQWGSVFITANSTATVTYPISFPNAAFIVIADGGETVTNRQDNGPAVSSFNNFNASITNGIDVGISTRWFAIGW